MRVLIFTEGGENIGLGHISRCSSLYEEVTKREIPVEMIIYGDFSNVSFLENKYFKNENWINLDFLNSELKQDDLVIIDSYLAPKEIYEYIASIVHSVIYIDDNDRIEYPLAGTIVKPYINLNPNAKLNRELLSGAEYIILREPFIDSPYTELKSELSSVLIIMGGMDTKGITEEIIETIVSKQTEIQFDIVVGAHKVSTYIERYSYKNVTFYTNLTASEIRSCMLKSDLAITAAGQTIFELIATRTPFIPIQVADNQGNNMRAVREIVSSNILINSEDNHYLYQLTTIFNQMKSYSFRKGLLKNMEGLVDGKGRVRIIDYLLGIEGKKNNIDLLLRKAKLSDMENIFLLSNKDYVRKHSINPNTITWDEHVHWFNSALENTGVVFYIVTDTNEVFLGQVRFNLRANQGIISISLSQECRGKGLAGIILNKAIDKVFNEHEEINRIIAEISQENLASVKTFKHAGFKEYAKSDMMKEYELTRGEFYDN